MADEQMIDDIISVLCVSIGKQPTAF